MGLKENVKAIKEELGAEEQFLESIIKAEGFWKKYKKLVIALVVLLVVGLLTKAVMGYTHDNNIESSNNAYNALIKDSGDTAALATLKSSNPKLYEMYLFKTSMASKDVTTLEKSKQEISDPVLKNLLSYQIGSLTKKVSSLDAGVAKEFALLQEGYLLLQENKIKEAAAKFAQIPADSTLRATVESLKHFTGK
ncbi:MAG TPA: hypothetical protein EYG95_03045 [Campylobacterales bacterium]|nr:hypothetical protein [Campylobacterales bacterium]